MAHPIENILSTAMENLKAMIDVDTVVGKPVVTADGVTVIPISKVSFGFASGGGEYSAGAGVSLSPAAFLLVGNGQIRCIPVQNDLILQIGECLRQFTERKEGEGC